MKILNQGFDHVEFIVRDIAERGKVYERMGFEKIGSRKSKGTRTDVWAQGFVRIVLTQPDGAGAEGHHAMRFLNEQDEGICALAIEVDDAAEWYRETVKRGARPAMEPQSCESSEGTLIRAEVFTPGLVRYAFMQRKNQGGFQAPALFDANLPVTRLESPSPLGLRTIDHLTNNIGMGETDKWVKFYTECFGFEIVRHFDIKTGRTGLTSEVIQSKCGKVKFPINEATEKESQVQEFVDRMKGPGVQHLAFLSTDIVHTLSSLKAQGFKFLSVPHSYYETVPTRVKGVTEDLAELERLGILLDGETGEGKYLLQIFSAEIVGPFFFEFIQRKGDHGFGEGNFRALFQAIERDQVVRGVLKPTA